MSNGVLYTATSNGQFAQSDLQRQRPSGAASLVNAADALVPQTDWHNTDVPDDDQPVLPRRQDVLHPLGPVVALPARLRAGERRRRPAAVQHGATSPASTSPTCAAPSWRTTSSTTPTPPAGCSAPRGPATDRSVARRSRSPAPASTARPGIPARCSSSRPRASRPTTPPIADADIECTGLSCTFDSTGSSDPDGGIDPVGAVAVRRHGRQHLDLAERHRTPTVPPDRGR